MKKITSVLMVVLCGILFIGCGASKLSSNYNEKDLKTASENIVNFLVEGKYDDIVNMGDDELKSKLTTDMIKKAYTPLKDKLGKYKEIEKIVFQEKDGIAIAVVIANYENGKAQFTLSFNTHMKMVGIYMK